MDSECGKWCKLGRCIQIREQHILKFNRANGFSMYTFLTCNLYQHHVKRLDAIHMHAAQMTFYNINWERAIQRENISLI